MKCFERRHLLTSSKHKETTLDTSKKHENMIKRLVTNLEKVPNPFSSRQAKKHKILIFTRRFNFTSQMKLVKSTYKNLFYRELK